MVSRTVLRLATYWKHETDDTQTEQTSTHLRHSRVIDLYHRKSQQSVSVLIPRCSPALGTVDHRGRNTCQGSAKGSTILNPEVTLARYGFYSTKPHILALAAIARLHPTSRHFGAPYLCKSNTICRKMPC